MLSISCCKDLYAVVAQQPLAAGPFFVSEMASWKIDDERTTLVSSWWWAKIITLAQMLLAYPFGNSYPVPCGTSIITLFF